MIMAQAPPLSMHSPDMRRLFIQGIPLSASAADLEARFRPFGRVVECEIPLCTNSGLSRGYGFVSLDVTEKELNRCMSVYAKSKWQGREMRVQLAKPRIEERLQGERQAAAAAAAAAREAAASAARAQVIEPGPHLDPEADPLSVPLPSKWKRAYHNRLVPVLRFWHPDRSKRKFLVIDPSKGRAHRVRFPVAGQEKPIGKLMRYYYKPPASALYLPQNIDHLAVSSVLAYTAPMRAHGADSSGGSDGRSSASSDSDSDAGSASGAGGRGASHGSSSSSSSSSWAAGGGRGEADEEEEEDGRRPRRSAWPPAGNCQPGGLLSGLVDLDEEEADEEDGEPEFFAPEDGAVQQYHDQYDAADPEQQGDHEPGVATGHFPNMPFFFHSSRDFAGGCLDSGEAIVAWDGQPVGLRFAARGNMESIREAWFKKRAELSEEYKKLHKSAVRRQTRYQLSTSQPAATEQ
ncbi:hypothetical protein H696_02056 [Fonticula alba]|uniref:RRM domain-containing protein n=1 Tax=Fonticula alba TaxID=691883 RepID=A0A058ZA41_FONAL|nr:hypothetical protein H696_02056 [Fonticula alba]KCV71110.1 hypothetical protein H696_02056 [Fonticula alba]|eukprot:XP_009494233.1 hypothetical protein H696_02056 [Fonticula alba]